MRDGWCRSRPERAREGVSRRQRWSSGGAWAREPDWKSRRARSSVPSYTGPGQGFQLQVGAEGDHGRQIVVIPIACSSGVPLLRVVRPSLTPSVLPFTSGNVSCVVSWTISPEKECHLLVEAFERIATDGKLAMAGWTPSEPDSACCPAMFRKTAKPGTKPDLLSRAGVPRSWQTGCAP